MEVLQTSIHNKSFRDHVVQGLFAGGEGGHDEADPEQDWTGDVLSEVPAGGTCKRNSTAVDVGHHDGHGSLPNRASLSGNATRQCHSSSRPPAAIHSCDQSSHHGMKRRAIGSMIKTGDPLCAVLMKSFRNRSRNAGSNSLMANAAITAVLDGI